MGFIVPWWIVVVPQVKDRGWSPSILTSWEAPHPPVVARPIPRYQDASQTSHPIGGPNKNHKSPWLSLHNGNAWALSDEWRQRTVRILRRSWKPWFSGFHVKGFGGVHICNYIQMTSVFGCFFTDKKVFHPFKPRDQLGRHDSHRVTGSSVRKRLEPKNPSHETFSRTSLLTNKFCHKMGPVFPSHRWVFVDPLTPFITGNTGRGPYWHNISAPYFCSIFSKP